MTTPKSYEELAELGMLGAILMLILLPFWLLAKVWQAVTKNDY